MVYGSEEYNDPFAGRIINEPVIKLIAIPPRQKATSIP
jgi:hypothetical protein